MLDVMKVMGHPRLGLTERIHFASQSVDLSPTSDAGASCGDDRGQYMAARACLSDDIIMRGQGAGGPYQYQAEIRHGDDPAEAGGRSPLVPMGIVPQGLSR